MSHARYVGRVGALAVALGVGLAIGATSATAWADDAADQTSTSSGDTSSSQVAAADSVAADQPAVGGAAHDAASGTAGPATTTLTTTTSDSQTTTTVGGDGTPTVTFSSSTVDLSTANEHGAKTDAAESSPSTTPEVPDVRPTGMASTEAVEPIESTQAPTGDPAGPPDNPLLLSTLALARRQPSEDATVPSTVGPAATTSAPVAEATAAAATGTTSWLNGLTIVPGASVQLALQQITAAETVLVAQTWGQANLVSGVVAVVPLTLLVQAQLWLSAWQAVTPGAQGLVIATAGIPIVHQLANLTLDVTLLFPSVAQSWLGTAQTFTQLVAVFGSASAANQAMQLMSLAAQNGRVYGFVPLTMKAVTEPVVYMSINGGPSVPVLVDTGSAGLVIDPRYVGLPGLGTKTGSGTSGYSGGLTYTYDTYTTIVDFGYGIVTAPTSVNLVGAASQDAFAAYFEPAGVVGVLGIGPNAVGPGPSLPTTALPGELKDGVLIDETRGVLIFGPNPRPARVGVAGAPISNLEARTGNNPLQVVWVIIDSGGVTGTIPTYLTGTGQLTGDLPAGTTVSVYTADGLSLLYSYVTTAFNTPVVVPNDSLMNTGYTPFAQQPIYSSNVGVGGIGTTYFDYG
ncbi:hypothetical protein TUM20985_28200 [Mycobacterium antarcticum]|uniref:PecA family PE domain-processing aspartic protease n=1 Tax=unclassified Mycolicibacterium TaxID=2636767 RepID=UPI0023A61F97|nr:MULTISPECIES: PecA family PE domain-processing aspartic protease [unclassified Mycolicibacterium]BDX32273.1 hypothetical protein TUM20985_28200 [Mycolicibacterium sp. TUM20985]GLP84175.1 hypothetical protein TUM20984_55950 [Mycolicibacterium sp. TUM20984]